MMPDVSFPHPFDLRHGAEGMEVGYCLFSYAVHSVDYAEQRRCGQ